MSVGFRFGSHSAALLSSFTRLVAASMAVSSPVMSDRKPSAISQELESISQLLEGQGWEVQEARHSSTADGTGGIGTLILTNATYRMKVEVVPVDWVDEVDEGE